MGSPYTGLVWKYLFRLIKGVGAFPVQFYPEINAKTGTQWEAQRRLTGMASGERALSIIMTGDKPVDLKARLFGYTGDGLEADIYKNPSYTGGVANAVYNMNTIPGAAAVREFQLLTGFTLEDDGEQIAATISLIGPQSNQSKGQPLTSFGSNRILAPNTSFLLVFTSLSEAQDITARIEMYEGELDYPPVWLA